MLQGPFMRLGRLLTAVLAVWCLGCSSFDMLAGALKSGSVAACADSSGPTGGAPEAAASVTASSPSSTADQGCGSDHCAGTETVAARHSPLESAMPESFKLPRQFPAKVAREPSVPPPESRTTI